MLLAVIASLPLVFERLAGIDAERGERIASFTRQAQVLAAQGTAAQAELIAATRTVLQVAGEAVALDGFAPDNCNVFLAAVVHRTPWLKTVSVSRPDGTVICSSSSELTGLRVGGSAHFQEALRNGAYTLSGYLVGQRLGPAVYSAFPHFAAEGGIDAVLLAPLELSALGRGVASLAEQSGAQVLLYDAGGLLLAQHPQGGTLPGHDLRQLPLVQQSLAQPQGVFTGDDLAGVRRIFAYAQVPNSRFHLAVGFDETAVLAGIDRAMVASLAKLAAVTFLVLIAIWFGGARMILAPIGALTRTAQRLGRGEMARIAAADLPQVAEFVPLAAALDDMAGQVAARERHLRDDNSHLQELAHIDGLTGLANRRSFNDRLASGWQEAALSRRPIAVLMLDVDHFKRYNDHYGHIQGDACLRQVAAAIKAGTRIGRNAHDGVLGHDCEFVSRRVSSADFAARYGGEEFAVLLHDTDIDAAAKVAERLRRMIEELQIAHAATPRGHVTVSVGVAARIPGPEENPLRLTEASDASLYEAKRHGRNRVGRAVAAAERQAM